MAKDKVELDRGEAVIRLMAAFVAAGRCDYEQMGLDAVAAVDALEAALAADAKPAAAPPHKGKKAVHEEE